MKVDSIELGVSENNASAYSFYTSFGMTTKSKKWSLG